jgi:hypothetical protein
VILELHDPGNAVFAQVKNHEMAHAKAWQDAYENVIVSWTDKMPDYIGEDQLAVEAGTKALARAKLWKAVGGTPTAILRKASHEKQANDIRVHADKARSFTIGETHPPTPGSQPRVRVVLEPT